MSTFLEGNYPGYLFGLRRYPPAKISHLYTGSFNNVGKPMCKRGWTYPDRSGFSIFRGNQGENGTCDICLRRADAGLEPIEPDEYDKDKWHHCRG